MLMSQKIVCSPSEDVTFCVAVRVMNGDAPCVRCVREGNVGRMYNNSANSLFVERPLVGDGGE